MGSPPGHSYLFHPRLSSIHRIEELQPYNSSRNSALRSAWPGIGHATNLIELLTLYLWESVHHADGVLGDILLPNKREKPMNRRHFLAGSAALPLIARASDTE